MTKAERDNQIVLMRSLGCTTIDISNELHISVSTVKRVTSKHGTSKGSLVDEAYLEVRKQFIASAVNDEALLALSATSLRSTQIINDRVHIEAVKTLDLLDKDPAAALMRSRALNSLSNTSKLCADSLRSVVRIAPTALEAEEELPEIVVREMTAEDIDEIRRQQKEEEYELGITIRPESEPAKDEKT